MVELAIALLVFILVALLVSVLVLPIFTLLRTSRQTAELRARLDRLERVLRQLEAGSERVAEMPPAPTAEPADIVEVAIEAQPTSRSRWTPRLPSMAFPAGRSGASSLDVEEWIGRRGLGWAAIILLLFATGFFLKYAFENQWVGELGRVAIGVLVGISLCLGGLAYHRRGWRLFSQLGTAGGVAILYLANFGAFGYYHLLPSDRAAIFLVLLVAEAAALALLYEAPAIALMAVIGGLINPLLLCTEHDQYQNLFIYLTLLNAGVVGIAWFRHWRALATVALVGTQALFWAWHAANYHPEKLAAAAAFQTAIFGLYLAHSVLAHVLRRRPADIEDLVRLVVNAFFLAIAAYVLLDDDYHVWMGSLAIGLAVIYAALGLLVLRRRPEDQRQLLVVVSIALAYIAIAFPLQASAAWIAVGWAVEGLALWWFGLRIQSRMLRGMAAALLVLAIGRLVLVDTPDVAPRGRFVPFFNRYGLPAALVAVCVFAAAGASRRFLARLGPVDRMAHNVLAVAGVGLAWLIVSKESYDFCLVYFNSRSAQTTLSGVWAAYAALLLAIGFRLRSGPLRWSALGLFGLTLGKVVLIDMSGLSGFYRVMAFLVLAVMMAAAAWGYQKFQMRRLGP